MNLISPHSTLHTLYPHIRVRPPGTPYPRLQPENSVKVYSNPSESFAVSIDELVEGEKTAF